MSENEKKKEFDPNAPVMVILVGNAGSDTPDFILAEYLLGCLKAFDKATVRRTKWYGKEIEKVKEYEAAPKCWGNVNRPLEGYKCKRCRYLKGCKKISERVDDLLEKNAKGE